MSIFTRLVATFILGALGGSSLVCLLGNPADLTSASSSVAREEPPSPAIVQPVPPAPPAQTGPVAEVVLEATGKTRPAPGRQSLLAPTVLHPVVEVKVKAGDRVKVGQVLVKLDDDEPQADVRAKKAAVEISRITLREARRFLIAAEETYRKGALPETSLHVARTAAAKAEQDEKAAVAMLASSQAELEHYTVTAPIDGVVTWLNVVPGMVSRPGTTVWGEILNLDEIDVQCEVAIDQADHIAVGQTAKVWRERFPDTRWVGEVISVAVAADERTGLVPVRLHVKDSGERLRCNVEVKVRFGAETGVPTVADPKIRH